MAILRAGTCGQPDELSSRHADALITLKNQGIQSDTGLSERVLRIGRRFQLYVNPRRSNNMDVKTILWYLVLTSVTVAYLVVLAGVQSARSHDVSHHSRRMIVGCTIVGIWLVAYVLKQILFGRESFQGTERQYWSMYVPLFATHMLFAITTIALGAYNLYMGLHRLRYGSVGAMAAGMTTHRRIGHVLIGTFTGTMVTAYGVYLMLFVWFKG
jgi:uncharacterized membrane protein YozB (DUF420 family)